MSAVADAHGISRNTVRTQLRSIFAKTRISRQGELIKLLAQLGGRPEPADHPGAG